MQNQSLVFAVNGQRFELEKVDPSTTLLEFLRTQTRFTGAKLGCGEGGCGACVVLLGTYDPVSEQVEEFAISSCLTLIYSINFCSVTTAEGLGNAKDGFHSIHKRFSGFHASQCGFCTPGMCMSLYSALIKAEKSERPAPPSGFSKLTVTEAQKAISGNLCRCTGYRPIVDACKSFAADVDLEDLGLNAFWKKGENSASVEKLPSFTVASTFPEFLKSEIKSVLNCNSALPNGSVNGNKTQLDICFNAMPASLADDSWHYPKTVDNVYKLLNSKEFNGSMVKMVAGNTGSGVYKEDDLYDRFIDLKGIPELSSIKCDDKGIQIGATVTVSRAIEVLKEERKSLVFNKIAEHLTKVASEFVRNTASIGGNLILAQRKGLPSDIATALIAVDSTVCLQTDSKRLAVKLEEFLEMPPLMNHRTLLLSIHIPSWTSSPNSNSDTNGSVESKLLFETYRAAPRPLGNAVAYLNSAFLAHTSADKNSDHIIIDNLKLAFGAYGSAHAIRARDVEKLLIGKPCTSAILLEAIILLKKIIVPKQGTAHRAYRSSLAAAFLFDFLLPLCKDMKGIEELSLSNGPAPAENFDDSSGECFGNHDLLLSSKQLLSYGTQHRPIGGPTKKVGAELQSSGEAIYVDDIPSPKDCLFGAFIISTRPLARITDISFKATRATQKIITVISAADIPKGGGNIGCCNLLGVDPLFADSLAVHVGQPLGVVIAETQQFANMGAKQVLVDYSTEGLEPPILSMGEAVQRSSFFDVPPFFCPEQVGDFGKGMLEADHKILSAEITLPSQYYFYMETQTALAVPDEDNCMVVYSSTQFPEDTGVIIAKCLGVPVNNIRVITRRVGGGFGGKATKAVPVATACALAAYKLRRPVRMYVDRKTDMIMNAGRHPMNIKYSVGFKSDGKITALHIDLLIDAGIFLDYSPLIARSVIEALKKYNWGALSFDIKLCKTNLPSKSAMRAPGDLQGSFIAEAIIEHVASSLHIDTYLIRKKNLHSIESLEYYYREFETEASEYTLPSLFDKLVTSTIYSHRVTKIQILNSFSLWKKRGISCVPIVYPVTVRPTPGKVGILKDGSVVVEVGGIELGQGLWTKVKQMAAFSLGELWGNDIPDLLERIRVIQADTLSLIQGGWTAGSTTSESCCEAVRCACSVLVDRLKPLKDRLQEQTGSISWNNLIFQASLQSVNLSASTLWVPDEGSNRYLNYGAAVSEVEVDLLTGATTILQTDIIYDCGQSLNPAVDLGQIEGAFVQGIGFFMCEEYLSNYDGLVISDGTWTYKIPTVDNIPKKFNVEILNSGHHKKRVLSSKASGEPPLLLAASVHCATREAIKAARANIFTNRSEEPNLVFQLQVPATMPVVKELCGLDNVERYLEASIAAQQS
ncbi:indole-3-acetaldehyde oxidase [Dendrobium catenatum]|uniref:Indole-3-acetaldehyde oxidase n=1 Tax=Dendrobium catenatum TaxID=906689 RepID=A0A2I0VLX5_9ASPA|nr:indole-3-acetaldehyde oxidase [Dendrobium catenatum]PKU64420.1 Indole-3-acetaldehyde oxidase [Dendrobium catenatum]